MSFLLQFGVKQLDLSTPKIMGVLNVTPDSFSDGGEYTDLSHAVERGVQMISEGASMIDVGGESTGPGSVEVFVEEELSRIVPVIQRLRALDSDVWISVDTWKPEVARQALEVGADMVNDVTGLRGDSAMATLVAEKKVPVVIMYSKDATPRTTRENVHYKDVVKTIHAFFKARVAVLRDQGVNDSQIILDPGMGAFVSGDARYSMEILKRLSELRELGFPLLVGASRKGFIGEICGGEGPHDRLEGSLAAALVALKKGASLLRVHDVKETARIVTFFNRL